MLVKTYNVKTIVKNINTKSTNVILGQENEVLFGDGYINDILLATVDIEENVVFYERNKGMKVLDVLE